MISEGVSKNSEIVKFILNLKIIDENSQLKAAKNVYKRLQKEKFSSISVSKTQKQLNGYSTIDIRPRNNCLISSSHEKPESKLIKTEDEPPKNYEKIVKNKGFVYLAKSNLYVTSSKKNCAIYLKCFNRHCLGTASIIKGVLTENVFSLKTNKILENISNFSNKSILIEKSQRNFKP